MAIVQPENAVSSETTQSIITESSTEVSEGCLDRQYRRLTCSECEKPSCRFASAGTTTEVECASEAGAQRPG